MSIYEKVRQNKEILTLSVLSIIFFWKIIAHTDQIVFSPVSDLIGIETYFKKFYAESIMNYGELPLWTPYIFSGMPFLGNPQTGILYPLNILFLLSRTDFIFGYVFLADVLLMGLFTYAFSRTIRLSKYSSLIAAITFMFSETVTSRIYAGHLNIVDSFVWFPLVLLFFEQAIQKTKVYYGVLAGAALALLFLPGHIQFGVYGLIAATLYFIIRSIYEAKERENKKEVLKLVASIYFMAIIVFFSLFAAQMLPTLEFSSLANRAGGITYEDAAKFSLSPEYFITFLIPEFFGTPVNGTYFHTGNLWEQAGYVGVFPLILAMLGAMFAKNKYAGTFSVMALVVLLYSIKGSPLFSFLYNYVPGFDMFRGPARALFIYAFSVSVLAGFGSEILLTSRFKKQDPVMDKIAKYLSVLCIISAAAIIFAHLFKEPILSFGQSLIADKYYTYSKLLAQPLQYWYDFSRALYTASLKSSSIFTVLLSSITGLILMRSKLNTKCFKFLIIFLIIADLFSLGQTFIDTKPVDDVFLPPAYMNLIKGGYGNYRVLDTSDSLGQHIAIRYGAELVNGYDPSYLRAYQDFLWMAGNDSRLNNKTYGVYLKIPEISDLSTLKLLNTKYIIARGQLNMPELKQIYYSGNISIYEINDTLPRAYLVRNARIMKNETAVLYLLKNESFDKKSEILLEKDPKTKLANEGSFEEIKSVRHTPNRIDLKFTTEAPGFLVLSEIWYPGWKAYDNGQATEIFKADYILRSVPVERGKHDVSFIYSPDSYRYGKAISAIALLLSGILLFCITAETKEHTPDRRL